MQDTLFPPRVADPPPALRPSRPPAPAATAAAETAAVLVVYRLRGDLRPLLAELGRHVRHVVVADNAEQGHAELERLVPAAGATLLHTRNRGGLAGAYNAACARIAAAHPECRQVVFVDEDSDVSVLGRFLADRDVQRLLRDPGTAAVAPVYRDRATQLRGKHMRWQGARLRWLPRQFDGPVAVAFAINSLSVWRLDALRALGPYDERLAIDHVDTELCLRAHAAGLAVWVHGSYEFAHAIGERRRFRLFGREMQAGGHPPARRWLIGRNTAWLARRWLWRAPAFSLLCLSRLAYEGIGIVVAEERKAAKLWALARGTVAGLLARGTR